MALDTRDHVREGGGGGKCRSLEQMHIAQRSWFHVLNITATVLLEKVLALAYIITKTPVYRYTGLIRIHC